MNVELKALLTLVFDGINLVQDVLNKKNFFVLLPVIYQIASDMPPVAQNLSDLQAEILALSGSAQESDLISFIEQKFGASVDNVKAQAILVAVLKLIQDMIQDALSLQMAIKS